MGENIGSKIKSPGRRAMRALMQSKQRVITHEPVMVASRDTSESGAKWHAVKVKPRDGEVKPREDGNRTTRRAALKSKRTAQRQASRKRQAVGVAVDARHRISGWARRLGDAVDVRAFGRWLDCVRQVTFSKVAAGSR